MSKKVKDLQWQSVALEGFPVSLSENFQGFVGLEECTEYGLDNESKRQKKKNQQKELKKLEKCNSQADKKDPRKRKTSQRDTEKVSSKKIKLSNGFVVESCSNIVSPSQTNEVGSENINVTGKQDKDKIKLKENSQQGKKIVEKTNKTDKRKLGEVSQSTNDLTPEDMLTWSEFKLQEPIMRALTELGFKNPTKIQQLTLPAAIHGRRDILGAAETGSGKTLAFGLPILSGILKIKEKAAAKGLDVYDIPFKKPPAKKKGTEEQDTDAKKYQKNKKRNDVKKKKNDDNKKIKAESKAKESSEDGYSSADESIGSENDETVDEEIKTKPKYNEDNFKEEIEVPLRKVDNSEDEGNDSDEDNHIHVSEMLDSDDLTDNSDDSAENFNESDQKNDSNDESDDKSNDDKENENDNVSENDDDESTVSADELVSDEMSEGEVDSHEEDFEKETAGGIGCVKVVDNIEIPKQLSVKTGKPLYALIVTPTRELAIQISRHLIAVAKYTGIKVATIVGGIAAVKQERVLKSGPEVVVATPGRLWELLCQGQPHLQQLDSVKFLAIDETDRMIERGHFEELHPLLERLNADELSRGARQNFVFSATLTLVHDLPAHMKGKKVTKRGKILNRKISKMTPQQKTKRLVDMIGMTDPKVVDITTQNMGTAETLTECRITCSMDHKDAYLYYILERHPGRTIVFCNSIGSVRRLAQLLTILKCNPLPLHASMPQRQRLKNLERFRDNPHGLLIATDVAARGLDIPDIDHVIQYQVPRTAENYVHRSGRTARANKEGINVLMVEPGEAYLYSKLCLTLNKTSDVPTFPVMEQYLSPMKQLVSIARELDALELKKRRVAQARGWREKAAADMDMIIDDDDVPVQSADPTIEKALKAKRRQLNALLSRPSFPKGFSFKYPSLNDPAALTVSTDNALQVMKKAMESGALKKEKRKSKNAPLLTLSNQKRAKKSFKRRKSNEEKME